MNNEQNNLNGLLNVNPIPTSGSGNTIPTNVTPTPDANIINPVPTNVEQTIPGANLNVVEPSMSNPSVNNSINMFSNALENNNNESTIPGANLNIIESGTFNPSVETNTNMFNNAMGNSTLPPINSGDITPINSTPIETNTPNQIDVNNNLNTVSSSPFDIGINQTMSTNTEPLNTSIPTNNGPILSVEIPSNNNSTINTNLNNSIQNDNLSGNQTLGATTNEDNMEKVVSVKEYLLLYILCCIPLVGFIILILKAFGGKANKNIRNFARAQLLLMVIIAVISMLLTIIGTLLL